MMSQMLSNQYALSVPIPLPAPVSQTSPILLLPGELRNRIYSYCLEPKQRRLLRKPKPIDNRVHDRGRYGSLRYVCRQLRTEFTSVYNAHTVIVIHQPSVDAFIGTFYPQVAESFAKKRDKSAAETSFDCAYTGSSSIQGNLRIQTHFGLLFNANLLFYLCIQHPTVKVRFLDASASLQLASGLDALFQPGMFLSDLKNSLWTMEFTCSRKPQITLIYCAKVQARHDELRRRQSDYGHVKERLRNLGGPAMEDFNITIGPCGDVKHAQ